MVEWKTLEQQIQELWASRGLEVVEEKFRSLGDGIFEWVIVAKERLKS